MTNRPQKPQALKPSDKPSKPTVSESRGTRSRAPSTRPPYNPGLHRLVDGKQRWSEPLDAAAKADGFLGWHQRGYLPHRDAPGLTQFVTFRLCDSLPESRRWEWEQMLKIEDDHERQLQLQEYLDRGHGECWLRRPPVAALAEECLLFFHLDRYELDSWVIMPNHIHVLVRVWHRPLTDLVQRWKSFTAREANRILGRFGPFWEREYWDTFMRDREHLLKSRRYTEQNPVKARLAVEAQAWPWSSARFRDAHGEIRIN